MNKWFISGCLALALVATAAHSGETGLVSRGAERHRVLYTMEIENTTREDKRSKVVIPYFSSNGNQEIEWLRQPEQIVKIHDFKDGIGQMAECLVELPAGKKVTLELEFIAKIHDLHLPFREVSEVRECDLGKAEYELYTRAEPPLIDFDHPELVEVHAKLSGESANALEYAKKALLFSIERLRYQKRGKGVVPLVETLELGRGDCGNKNLLFVALLRKNGIPARLASGICTDNEPHARSEFYLTGYGWVPADATTDIGEPSRDRTKEEHLEYMADRYFGRSRNVIDQSMAPLLVETYNMNLKLPLDNHGFLEPAVSPTGMAYHISGTAGLKWTWRYRFDVLSREYHSGE